MAGKITNPIQLTATLVFHTPDGEPAHVEIVEHSIHYGRECEHGSLGRKGGAVPMTPTMLNAIKDFFEESIAATNVNESYTPENYGPVQWPVEPEPEPDP